jgi:peptidoglycan/LPS O-acetylase OafA/YrhL
LNLAHTHHKEIPSLDGWRAVAIAIVFLSHAGLGELVPGGLGVTIFFFLSGYLITTLLLREYGATRTIHIRNFYIRRALRLTPPLVLVLVGAYLLTAAGLLQGNATWRGFFAQLFYFANYYVLFFDPGHTVPRGTGIFWSLAVEEHFYFVFPALLLLLLARIRHALIPVFLALLCVLVLSWRLHLVAMPDFSMSRTYYATDTRIDSILYGCILATVSLPQRWQAALRSKVASRLGIAGGALVILLTLLVREESFREGLRYSLQGLALIPLFYYSIGDSTSFLHRLLNLSVMRKIGVYSYSIYLIHHILLENLEAMSSSPLLNGLAAAAVALLFAFLIDRYLDTYLRQLRVRFR